MVVISIIGILGAIVGFSTDQAREIARDGKRMSDIDQIGLAIRLYEQENGSFDCSSGTVLETGRGPVSPSCVDEVEIKQYLVDYFGEIPTDPRGPGHDDYYYYYDSVHSCFSSASAAMVFAVNLESKESNVTEACEIVSGSDGGYLSTANINPSIPYVFLINRQ